MHHYLIFIFIAFTISGKAQNQAAKDTLFNQSDKLGHKQGFWKAKYDNGVVKYTAFFKDDKPVGEMKRYFEDGTLKAIMFFDKSGITRTKLYYQDGPLAAEGNYVNSAKDSTWNYYSFYTKTLSNRESYYHGKKNGKSVSFFSNGKIAEESEWKLGARNGIWKQYYENEVLKLSATYIDGKRQGEFVVYYPDKNIEWNGNYVDDKCDGKWEHFDPTGKSDITIIYKDGEALNSKELDAKEQELLKAFEKQKGKIPEPDETNFLTPSPK